MNSVNSGSTKRTFFGAGGRGSYKISYFESGSNRLWGFFFPPSTIVQLSLLFSCVVVIAFIVVIERFSIECRKVIGLAFTTLDNLL